MDGVEIWVDGAAFHRIGIDNKDQFQHLAKVRVAGSNPVFRSTTSSQLETSHLHTWLFAGSGRQS